MKRIPTWFWLTVLSVAALLISAWNLPPHLVSGDDALTPAFTVDSYPEGSWVSALKTADHRAAQNPLRLAAYFYGFLHPVCMWATGLCYDLLDLTITEFTWSISVLLFGCLTPMLAFLFIRKISNERSAWLAALFIATCPVHLLQSRGYNPSMVQGFFLQICVVWSFWNYLESPTRLRAAWAGILLAIYIHTELQWPSMGPVLLCMIPILDRQSAAVRQRAIHLVKKFLRWEFAIFPTGAILFLVAVLFAVGGPLKHMMHKGGRGEAQFLLLEWWNMHLANNGWMVGILLPTAVLGGLCWLPTRSPKSILWVWGAWYSLPFWFWAGTQTTMVGGYISHGLWAFLLVAAVLIGECDALRKKWFYGLIALGVAFNVYCGMAKCYARDWPYSFHNRGYRYRVFQPDCDYKAAGAWVREHVPADKNIFSFAVGGAGLETEVCVYYLDRLTYVLDDKLAADQRAFFSQVADRVDHVLVEQKDMGEWRKAPESALFSTVAQITSKGHPVLQILQRNYTGAPETIAVEEYNRRFDEKYGNLRSLHGYNTLEKRDGPLAMPDTPKEPR